MISETRQKRGRTGSGTSEHVSVRVPGKQITGGDNAHSAYRRSAKRSLREINAITLGLGGNSLGQLARDSECECDTPARDRALRQRTFDLRTVAPSCAMRVCTRANRTFTCTSTRTTGKRTNHPLLISPTRCLSSLSQPLSNLLGIVIDSACSLRLITRDDSDMIFANSR